jgi:hypothetical protein
VQFIPQIIDVDSGIGRGIAVQDLNRDNQTDIVIGNRKGAFVYLQGNSTTQQPTTQQPTTQQGPAQQPGQTCLFTFIFCLFICFKFN